MIGMQFFIQPRKSLSLFNVPDYLLRLLIMNGKAFSRGSFSEAKDSAMKLIGTN
jgi:hypothetical protein